MTKLLISVRDEDEARAALRGGADLIDVKEPSRGSLGAASPECWSAVLNEVAGQRPVSAALGELSEIADIDPTATTGLAFVKAGLAGCRNRADWVRRWRELRATLPESVRLVAVAYADHQHARAPAIADVLSVGVGIGCQAFLLDTFQKRVGADLLSYCSPAELERLVRDAQQHGLLSVLAGSLQGAALATALAIGPDYIALRGAVCRGDRTGRIDEKLVRELARAISPEPATSVGLTGAAGEAHVANRCVAASSVTAVPRSSGPAASRLARR